MDNSPPQNSRVVKLLRWLTTMLRLDRRGFRLQAQLLGAALLVGVVAGLGAVLFSVACDLAVHLTLDDLAGYHADAPAHEAHLERLAPSGRPLRPWMLLIVPTVGGLVSGWIVFRFAPEAEGHGTDAAIGAYHHNQGLIRPRVPVVKLLASAITLGTGGSGGREGPIAQIGAGFGSYLANLLRLRPADRRILMAAGMGAGVAAIFRAPLAGALFASEVLYRSPEFESDVIIPAGLASVASYCTFGMFFQWKPLFDIQSNLAFENPVQLLAYLLLAGLMVVLAAVYTRSFYGVTALFRRLKILPHLKPAIGALASGVIAVALYYAFGGNEQVLSVLSFGYGILQDGMTDNTPLATVLLAVALGKILTTSLTIGSGGSGGVFGPSMVIGGCGGGALGIWLQTIWPDISPASFMIVGMAGFFTAAAKTPFSTLIIVSEMTGGYSLLLPALWVCALAFMISDQRSIYASQVEGRSRSPAHQGRYVREILGSLRVGQFLKAGAEVPKLHADDPLATVIDRLGRAPYAVLPVVDDEDRLLGVANLDEAFLVSQSPHLGPLLLATDLMRSEVIPLHPEDSLDRALELFVENDLSALPVVSTNDTNRVVGIVRRADIASTYLRHVHGKRGAV